MSEARILRVLDIETTGMEPPAEIIEIGYCDLTLFGGLTEIGERKSRLFGCVTPCPPEAMAVHHITAADLAGLEPCTDRTLASLSAHGAEALVAHNAAFEGQWFTEAHRGSTPMLCTLKAALRVWPDAPGHSNQVLRYWLDLKLERTLADPPHRAGPDAYVTAHILQRLMDHASIEDMLAWTLEPRLLSTCPIGKFRGFKWPDVEVGFLRWMLQQPTMEEDLKWNAQREIDRRAA